MKKRTRAGAGKRRRGAQRRMRIPWIPMILVGAVLIGGYFVVDSFGVFGGGVGERQPDLGRQHIPEGQSSAGYASRPATSGPHWPSPARWGVYATQFSDERTVHNLEHGGILIAYNGVAQDDIDRLARLRSSYPRGNWPETKILIEPYKDLPPGAIAVAAWSWLEKLTVYDEQRILTFIRAHMDKCCESLP